MVLLLAASAWAQNSPQIPIPYPDWAASDGLGRILPQAAETGPRRSGKYVGLFYYLWHGADQDIKDLTQLIKANPTHPDYGPAGSFHWWGKPEAGYYRAADPWVIRRNLQMIAVAGVDFIFFDVTNAYTYLGVVDTLCSVSNAMRAQGIPTPRIAFCTFSSSGRVMNELYDKFYALRKYQDLWFQWEGKPLILGDAADQALRPEVKAFFNIKYSWAWTDAKNKPDQWQWIDTYPQDFGWKTDKTVPDQIPVAKASHPTSNIGDSYMNGAQPAMNAQFLTPYTGQGRNFAEQWQRALQVDPKLIMVTQWNEWVAQRQVATVANHPDFLGRPTPVGGSYFVDLFNQEFNRDIEPMEGGHGDNHYYMMVDRIRRFKGMDAPQSSPGMVSIAVDGAFADWAQAGPVYHDPRGDVFHRDYNRFDSKQRYTNVTGRNDIIEARTAWDGQNAYFYAKTADALTPSSGQDWMQLFIDADRNPATGWSGFDFAVNATQDRTDSKTAFCRWSGSAWVKVANVDYRYAGSEIEIGIPKALLGSASGDAAYQFQWVDNAHSGGDIAAFALDGDAAPDRRFRYAFASRPGSAIRTPGSAPDASARRIAWRLGSQSGSLPLPAAEGWENPRGWQAELIDSRGRVAWHKDLIAGGAATLESNGNGFPAGHGLASGLYWIRVRAGALGATSQRVLLLAGEAGEIRAD